MNKDEALKLALEALENGKRVRNAEGGAEYQPKLEHKAITAIQQALAEPVQEPDSECNPHDLCAGCRCKFSTEYEPPAQPAPVQEPVAWMHWLNGPCQFFMNEDEAMIELDRLNREYPEYSRARKMRPLVFGDTTPPAVQRQWVGLTIADRSQLRKQFGKRYPAHLIDAIEAKIKEKNT